MARLERPGSDPARLDAVRAYIDTLIDGYKGDPLPGTVVRDAALAELDRIASEPAPASPPLAAIVDAADTISLDELRAEEARLERALAFVRGAREGLERLENPPAPTAGEFRYGDEPSLPGRDFRLESGDVRPAEQDPPVPPEAATTTATSDEDPPAPPEPDPAPAGPPTRARLLAHYRENPDQWIGSGAAANALNITPTGVKVILDDLTDAGLLEHNGKKGPNSRYRAKTNDPIADALTAEPVPQIGSRQTLALERNGATAGPSTLQGRTLQALSHHGPMTLARLAARLELDTDGRRKLPATILRLEREGEVKSGRPPGATADLYRATDPTL
jgi:hypothetical protein